MSEIIEANQPEIVSHADMVEANQSYGALTLYETARFALSEAYRVKPRSARVGANGVLTKTQSSKWQGLARLPEDKFEIRVEHAKSRVAWSSTSAPSSGDGGAYAGENEWHTPPSFVELAREVLGVIDLDPASHVLAQTWIQAARYFTIGGDGLKHPWSGRVFLNPPYERALLAAFVDKLLTEYASGSVTQAILLTHACVDTGWFHAAARAAPSICFARGRIHFVAPSGDVATSRELGQAFFYLGPDRARFERVFSAIGLIVRPS
jgi:DNA N-6-adenine-methyltransferase (Dam)